MGKGKHIKPSKNQRKSTKIPGKSLEIDGNPLAEAPPSGMSPSFAAASTTRALAAEASGSFSSSSFALAMMADTSAAMDFNVFQLILAHFSSF